MGLDNLYYYAHSLTAHGQELKHYISTFSFVVHVLCIFTIQVYTVLRKDRLEDVKGGGIGKLKTLEVFG